MPWNKEDGGGNNQGPWGQGPWGQGPKRPQGGGRGPNPPDLDELLRRGQDKLKQALPQGGGRWSWLVPVLLAAAYVVFNSIYQVQPDERGVVLRFGQFNRHRRPGPAFRHLAGRDHGEAQGRRGEPDQHRRRTRRQPDADLRQEHHLGAIHRAVAHRQPQGLPVQCGRARAHHQCTGAIGDARSGGAELAPKPS